ncbi:hypothetical protein DFP72DRAFT_1080259 [Ephemerocybe angulata]|uniref:Uncharacterized protein n=1 Tax=Ephemerocybe angulata TaxID=980116 RepID=A0A8H6HAD0_9AGAR|nr:hypothetical protein DFP72DRAFT_1080259 [Tulosesus angulatus]
MPSRSPSPASDNDGLLPSPSDLDRKREGSRAAIKYAKEHGVVGEAPEARVTLSGGIPAKEL